MYRIRLAEKKDSGSIIEFQMLMAKESEGIDLDKAILSDGVISVFNDSAKGRYFVVESEDKAIASMMVTYEWSDWRNKNVWWLQSVYVLPQHRGKGVFRLMYEHVQKLVLDDNNIAGIRLYVDNSNTNAIKVYQSLGMNGDHYRVFEWMKD